MTYTREQLKSAKRWAEHYQTYKAPNEWEQSAADLIANLPEPENDETARTFADMTDEERRDHTGNMVLIDGWSCWYLGESSCGNHMAVAFKDGKATVWHAHPDEITLLPGVTRMVIPGVTRPLVQQEPPENPAGWWATIDGERVLGVRWADEIDAVDFYTPNGDYIFTNHVAGVSDWSRERDIEGPDNA